MRFVVVVALLLGACTTTPPVQPQAPSENGQPAAQPDATSAGSGADATQPPVAQPTAAPQPPSAPTTAPAIDEIRATHPVRNEGAQCAVDDNCDAPLRCIATLCAYPPAMTGVHDTTTPLAVFYTQGGDRAYYLELAATGAERTRGLMFRRFMVADWGMLFLFDAERQQTFWMRNTLLGLDMVFIRSDMTVDSIQANATPQTDTPRPSTGPAQFVLELNAGEAARVGIVPGTRVEFLNLPTTGG
jgi:uncharacterized membrane protein (UPF0127 family)